MIGTMHIRLSAARPNLPLGPYHVFAGSAVSFTIVDLPRPLGVRKIESVTLAAKSVAGATSGYAATRVGSAWGVTVPAGFFATSGFVEKGIVIEAGGIDDNGAPVTPWILGAADLVVMERDGSIAPGETSHVMHWHDTRPEHPAEGDVAPHDGGVFYFNGSEWVEIGGGAGTVKRSDFAGLKSLQPQDGTGKVKELVNTILDRLTNGASAFALAIMIGGAAWADFGPDTIKDDIPGTATVREIVQAGGGGGGGIDTNAVKALIETEAGPTNAIVRLAEDLDGNRTALLVGTTTNELGVGAVALGSDVDASGRRAVAIGNYAKAQRYNSIAIGEHAYASGFEPSVAIGSGAGASGDHSVAIGTLASATGYGSVAIGGHAEGYEAVAIGRGATASGDNSFVWSGINSPYSSGNGTFTVNPRGGADGFYIGMLPLSWLIREDAKIAATNAIDESLSVDGAIFRFVTGQVIPAYEASIRYTDAAMNATLAAANAYTDAHAGTGGLSTNAVLALIEDSVGGTNAVRAAVAHTAVGPTWMRPNAWRLTATPTRDVAEIAAIYFSTNNYRTYSNEVARVITTRSAQLRGERLDRYAVDPLIVTNFAAVTPGCSVDQLGYVTAEADGQYRVAGTDSTGETRYCDIWFSAGIRDTVLNTIYVGDLVPHLAAANDAALDVLDAAALVGTYTVSGKTCNQYSTIAPAFAKSGAHGYYNPWAVSGHILMTAGHLGYMGDSGPITYGSTTLDRGHAYWLKDWALEHGFTPAEVNAVSMIGDIELIVCTGGPIPAADLPTFISPARFAERFPGGLNGAVVWSANQHHADMVPRVVIDSHGHTFAGDDRWAGYSARADLAAILAAMGQQHIFHGGDSGHVVFLRDDGYDIPLTQYYYASGGPDLVAAYPMLKAFVESFGDTLKEVE